jgi:hypothetical protein
MPLYGIHADTRWPRQRRQRKGKDLCEASRGPFWLANETHPGLPAGERHSRSGRAPSSAKS